MTSPMPEVDDFLDIDVEEKHPEEVIIAPTGDGMVTLPVGLLTPDGIVDTAEVRELNGYDEEAYGRSKSTGAGAIVLMERATVRVGGGPADKKLLDRLSVGDRVELMLAIHVATWGDEIDSSAFCESCDKSVDVQVNVSDIPRIELQDKVQERTFNTLLPSGVEATLTWPSGVVQEKLLSQEVRTLQELTTLVITDCVKKIDGIPLLNAKDSARALGVRDRQHIVKCVENSPGPQLNEVKAPCPYCGASLEFALQVGDLFPL